MSFAKLDEGLILSSIAAENDAVFKVFTLLLSKCRQDSISPLSPVFLSSITRKPIEEIEHCLKVLESPDPHSRSTVEDGRRIRRVDGGFFIINYAKYRIREYSENPEAVKKRKQRDRLKGVPGHSGTCPGHSGVCPGHSSSISPSFSQSGFQDRGAGEGIESLIPDSVKGKLYEAAFKAFLDSRRRLAPIKGKPYDTLEIVEQGVLPQLISLAGPSDEKRLRILQAAVSSQSFSLFLPDDMKDSAPADASYTPPAPNRIPETTEEEIGDRGANALSARAMAAALKKKL